MVKGHTVFGKEVWAGWMSSFSEAYNMAIYSFSAPFLAAHLFPTEEETGSLFFSYLLSFFGYCLFYPAGAIYYGMMGDEKGRQKTCTYSTLGLAIATGLLAFVPLHEGLGSVWIYFFVLICAQYFFSGGEYHGSAVFSLEHSQESQKGWISGLSCLFSALGLVAANGLATYAFFRGGEEGIRACFLIGGLSGLTSYFLKYHCKETPLFLSSVNGKVASVDLITLIQNQWKQILAVVLVLAFFIVSYTFIFIFLPLVYPYGYETLQSLVAYGIFLLLAGFLADCCGMEKIMGWGLCLFSILSIPLCSFCQSLWAIQLILLSAACLVIGPIHSWVIAQFKTEHRCRGVFLSSAIAMSLFGGSTVPICLLLYEKSQTLVPCSIYVTFISLMAFGAFLFLRQANTKLAYENLDL